MRSVDLPFARQPTGTLWSALMDRCSTRSGGPLSLPQVADVLTNTDLAVPSAGSLYAIVPHVALAEPWGVFRFEPDVLHEVAGGEAADLALSRAAAAMHTAVFPPAVVLLRGEPSRLEPKYPKRAHHALMAREAGVWLGTLGIVAAGFGIGGCCLGPAAWGEEDMAAFALWG